MKKNISANTLVGSLLSIEGAFVGIWEGNREGLKIEGVRDGLIDGTSDGLRDGTKDLEGIKDGVAMG